MLSYKFIVNPERNNTLRIRLTNNRKKTELSLGIKISPEDLEDALSRSPKPQNLKWKSVLSVYQSKLDDIKCELIRSGRQNMDVKDIRDMLVAELFQQEDKIQTSTGNFLSHFIAFANRHQNKRTCKIYLATVSRMLAFEPNLEKFKFEDVTVEWLTDFDLFLMEKAPSKNARNIHFRNIRAVIKDAFKADLTTAHPFDRFKHNTEATRKRSLSIDVLRAIFNAEVEPWQQKYLDFFKLSFMLVGINVVDLCSLTEIQDGRIRYFRAKTHKFYSIKVEPEAMEIIERNRGSLKLVEMVENYKNYRHFYNNLCIGLMAIKKRLGVDELTTYWARHSWATIARKIGVPIDDIAFALGHKSNHRVTYIYIDDDFEPIDIANRRVLDWVLYGKL